MKKTILLTIFVIVGGVGIVTYVRDGSTSSPTSHSIRPEEDPSSTASSAPVSSPRVLTQMAEPASATAAVALSKSSTRESAAAKVEAARSSRDPLSSYQAAKQIDACASVDSNLEAWMSALTRAVNNSEQHRALTTLVQLTQAQQRDCQTLSSEQLSQRDKLLETAAQGGVEGAASEYWETVPSRRGEKWLHDGVQQDAKQGDTAALFAAANRATQITADPVAAAAYRVALIRIAESSFGSSSDKAYASIAAGWPVPQTNLTEDERKQIQTLAAEIELNAEKRRAKSSSKN